MSHVPLYVYFVFLILLWMGISSCYAKTIRIERMSVMPVIMLTLGMRSFFGLFPIITPANLAAGFGGTILGLVVGYHHASLWKVKVDRARRTIHLPGDKMMLIIILASFAFEFALHYSIESGAVEVTNPTLSLIAAAIWALFIGMSVGRNGNLVRRYAKTYKSAEAA